jgi:hypothetical protein
MATLVNAAGRQVVIEVAADPDIVIFERSIGSGDRPLVAIEVKAGTDVSNIHNRIGEAEKSHLKAKARKFTECWTIVNVNKLDPALAAQQSPTTHRFFRLSELMQTASRAHTEFVVRIGGSRPSLRNRRVPEHLMVNGPLSRSHCPAVDWRCGHDRAAAAQAARAR